MPENILSKNSLYSIKSSPITLVVSGDGFGTLVLSALFAFFIFINQGEVNDKNNANTVHISVENNLSIIEEVINENRA